MLEEVVKIPDPILGEPKRKPTTFRKKVLLVFLLGFLAGWFWMTWAMVIKPPVGLDGISFWRLLLPL